MQATSHQSSGPADLPKQGDFAPHPEGSAPPVDEVDIDQSDSKFEHVSTQVDQATDRATKNAGNAPTQPPDKQWGLIALHIVVLGVCFFFAFANARSNPKVAFAWLAASILWSSVIGDYVHFTSDKHKKLITSSIKVGGGIIAILTAYFLSS